MMPESPQVEWEFRQPATNEPAEDDALLAALARLLWERSKRRKESTPKGREEPDAIAG